MKPAKIILCLMALIILSTVGEAYNTTLDTQIIGGVKGGFNDWTSPNRIYISSGTFYTQLDYAGQAQVELAFCSANIPFNIECGYYNQTGTTLVLTLSLIEANSTCDDSVLNWSKALINISSNTGIMFCQRKTGTGGFYVSTQNSNITWIAADYSLRSYVAGSSYSTYVIDKYFEGDTVIQSGTNVATFFSFPNLSTSYLNLTTFTPSCDQTTGIVDYNYFNYNRSDGTQTQNGLWYANITAISDLNFTIIYPSFPQTVDVGTVVNFTVAANNPSAVDGVIWYVTKNGSASNTVQTGTNYSLSYNFTAPGIYLVEAQLEDITCQRFRTANFTVQVGKVVTLTGQVTDTYGNPLDAQVRIINGDYSWDSTVNVLALEDGGRYNFSNLAQGNYTVLASSPGQESEFKTLELLTGLQFNTPRVYDFQLSRLSENGSLTVYVVEYDSGELLTNYTLTLKQNSSTLLVVTNGTVTSNFLGLTVDTSNPNVISGLPLGDYEVTASKVNYLDTNDSTFPTKQSFNIGSLLDWTTQVYLKINPNYSDNRSLYYANFSNPSPISGTNIDVSSNDVVGVSLDFNSTLRDRFIICFSYRQEGYPWTQQCSPTRQQGNVRLYATIYDVVNGTTYYWLFTAEGTQNPSFRTSSASYLFTTNGTGYGNYTIPPINISNPQVCNPIGCGAACNQSCVYQWAQGDCSMSSLVKCTQSCAACITTTTIVIPSNATATNVSFNCTNLTGKLKSGDVFHCAVCPFIMVLGVSWFYGLSLLFILATTYHLTKTWAVPGILALLYTSAFITLLPQPAISYLSIGVGLGVGMTIYGLFRK